MKRVLALLLALVMTMALVACGGDKPTSTPTTPSTPTQPSTPSTPTEPSKPADPSTPATPEKPAEDPDAWKYGGDLIIGTSNTWNTFDPHNCGGILGPCLISLHLFETWAIRDANGQIYGQVCDIEESADGCTVKFTLRERYFSNGQKITMDDLLASLHRAVGSRTSAQYDKNWAKVSMKVEGNSVIFTMPDYNINFIDEFVSAYSHFKIMPKSICDKYPVTGGELQPNGFVKGGTLTVMSDTKDVIGSGPYTLQSYSESEVVFARNENYQPIKNEGAVGVAAEAKCYLDTITVQLNTDAASRTAATITGEYDLGSVSADMVETALTMGVKKITTGTAWTHAIFFNLHESNADSPVYDVNVRKAIRAIIDCNAVMLSILSGDASRINLDPYPVVKELTAYNTTIIEDTGEWNNPNLELAKEYLKKANYDGTPLVYLTNATGAFYKACMAVVPMMESIGLKVEVMAVDGGSHGALRKDPSTGHDIGCWETQKNFINPVMQSSFVNNQGGEGWWSHPDKTEYLKIMNSTPTNSPESVDAYLKFMQLVADEVPYIAFGFPNGIGYCRENVQRGALAGKDTFFYWNDYFLENPRHK